MNIIIFGGSFDPIHNAHIEIASKAYSQINADKLIFVPNKTPHFNKVSNCEPWHRFQMIKLAINKYSDFYVSNIEINNKSDNSYSFDTLKKLKKKFKNHKLFLLIGNDQLENFDKWKKFDEILKMCTLLVYERENFLNYDLLRKYNAIKIEGNSINISSSEILNQFQFQNIPKVVLNYIVNNGLYYNEILSNVMDNKRYLHSLRVAKMMKNTLKVKYPWLVRSGWLAGLYHDYCKKFEKEQLEYYAYNIIGLKKQSESLLHGPVASWYLKYYFDFKNSKILIAIARHTMPYENCDGKLTILDMALYCCDKLEPLRSDNDIENIEYYRKLLTKNIKKCFKELFVANKKQYN